MLSQYKFINNYMIHVVIYYMIYVLYVYLGTYIIQGVQNYEKNIENL